MSKKRFKGEKTPRSPHIFSLISKFRNLEKRNQVRGYSAKRHLLPADMNAIRQGNSVHDSGLAGAILKGPHGLSYRPNQGGKRTAADLFVMTGLPALEWKKEVHYTSGYINAVGEAAVDAVVDMSTLANLESYSTEDALARILKLAKKFGASNFLSYKLAYIRSARHLDAADLALVSEIEEEIRHRDSAGLHFSALENLSSKISLFVVARRRISGLIGKVDGDLRRAITLSNFIPTPLNEGDVAGFLLRATESCLLDVISAIITLYNLSTDFPAVCREFSLLLSSRFQNALLDLIKATSEPEYEKIVTEVYRAHDEFSDASLDLYRISSAFLEKPALAAYRNQLDRVIGARLLAEIVDGKLYGLTSSFDDKNILLRSDGAELSEKMPPRLDSFYRTYLFLRFLGNRANLLTLSRADFRFIFEHTVWLESLLTEDEMRDLYVMAHPDTKGLVAILALALFRKRSIDPDIDFEFRTDFISYVTSEHGGSIIEFINYLLGDSPQIANYIVNSLDEVTLEKLYSLVENATQAAQIRCDILRAVGQKFNRIEYFVEADGIETRVKVSRLQKYFDSSRMYVDSVSMKKWLDGNPTMYTEQYRALYTRIEAKMTSVEVAPGIEKSVLLIQLNDHDEYLVSQIAKDAFEQFCLNSEFGIESYLGRRIRHNTLDGVTLDTVDAVLRKPAYAVCMTDPTMRRTVQAWMASYKGIVDKLRREYLQFKAPASLFKANLDTADALTQENIQKLRFALRELGAGELLNDLVIAFCWKQIAPQLENAARFIKTTILNEANASIDRSFFGHHGNAEAQLRLELHEAVNEVFKKVADWFQVPQTGFISATGRELCEIIRLDLNLQSSINFEGNALDAKYTGISVHRLYDCLAVLLQNAVKHGEAGEALSLDISGAREGEGAFDLLNVVIRTKVARERYLLAKQRIVEAISSVETGADMVTEGYTGIKKIKFITRASEGRHTVVCEHDDDKCELAISFRLRAERVSEDAGAER